MLGLDNFTSNITSPISLGNLGITKVVNNIYKEAVTTGTDSILSEFTVDNIIDTAASVAKRTAALTEFNITANIPPELRQVLRIKINTANLEPIPIIAFPSVRLPSKHYEPVPNIQFKTKSTTPEYRFTLYNANMDGIEDSKTASWTETVVPGRFEPIATYANSSSRSFVIKGALFINSGDAEEEAEVKRILNTIRAMVFPLSAAGAITSPPLWSVDIFGPGQANSFTIDQVRVNSYNIVGAGPILANGMYAVYQIDINITEVVSQVDSTGLYAFTNRDFSTVAAGGEASGALERYAGTFND